MSRVTADAVVIGAGVIGTAIAFELGKLAYKTINVDRLPAAGHGSTSSSSAIIRFHYPSWDGVAMSYEAAFHWLEWDEYIEAIDERGTAIYSQTGVILLKSGNGVAGRCLPHFDALGVRYDELSTSDLRSCLPGVDLHEFWPPKLPSDPHFWDEPTHEIAGAVLTPTGGYMVDPQLATHNLQRAAEGVGGRFIFQRSVTTIRRDAAATHVSGVTLDDGTQIDAPIVINAAGPHSYMINRLANVDEDMHVTTRPLRQEVHHVPSPESLDFASCSYVISDGDLGIYYRPDIDSHILVGSEEPPCDRPEWVRDPDDYNRDVTKSRWQAHAYRLGRRLPDLRVPTRPKGVVDLYDVSDDLIPIYDKSNLGGFYMAIGTSGHQFKNAPVVGRYMAALVDAVEKGHDHDSHPLRLPCRYIDAVLDGGFYSRKRLLNSLA